MFDFYPRQTFGCEVWKGVGWPNTYELLYCPRPFTNRSRWHDVKNSACLLRYSVVLHSLKLTIHQNYFHYTLVFLSFFHYWDYLWKHCISSNGSEHNRNDFLSTPQGIRDLRRLVPSRHLSVFWGERRLGIRLIRARAIFPSSLPWDPAPAST